MAFTLEQIAKLEEAIANGTVRDQIGDLVKQYQTIPDLLKALQAARADQASASNTDPLRYRVARSCDG